MQQYAMKQIQHRQDMFYIQNDSKRLHFLLHFVQNSTSGCANSFERFLFALTL